uniref:Uncharacterized protein n=1 Tax=Trypanosoma vivax (strain Y486) TaxID=1055687 RepID=G0U1H5_TRYVY|nr:hypothetical protein TVY486_0805390 [Trypanosoma vivax Y486]
MTKLTVNIRREILMTAIATPVEVGVIVPVQTGAPSLVPIHSPPPRPLLIIFVSVIVSVIFRLCHLLVHSMPQHQTRNCPEKFLIISEEESMFPMSFPLMVFYYYCYFYFYLLPLYVRCCILYELPAAPERERERERERTRKKKRKKCMRDLFFFTP